MEFVSYSNNLDYSLTLYGALVKNLDGVNIKEHSSEDLLKVVEIITVTVQNLMETSNADLCMFETFEGILNIIYNNTNSQVVKNEITEQAYNMQMKIVDINKNQLIKETVDLLHRLTEVVQKPTRIDELIDELLKDIVLKSTVQEIIDVLNKLLLLTSSSTYLHDLIKRLESTYK